MRICTGLQLAALDADPARATMLLADLDAETLRKVARWLTTIWFDAIFFSGLGVGLREAIADDALSLAAATGKRSSQ